MSKKKSSTTKPEARRPNILPITKTKGGKGKAPNKAKADADQTIATPAASDAPPPEVVAGQESMPAATEAPPAEDAQATAPAEQPTTVATETLAVGGAEATSDASQAATPAAETPPAAATKEKRKGKAKKEPKPKKMSCLDAAAKVLADAGTPMYCQEMIDAMAKAKFWSSPHGQTPSATLYSAILREINTKGKDARFTKTERVKFAAK